MSLQYIRHITYAALVLTVNSYHACFALPSSHPRIWASVEYLNWWVQDSPINAPLITKNNNPTALGFINEPGTSIYFGAGSNRNTFDFGSMGGGRATLGIWLDESYRYGIEGSAFELTQKKVSFNASSVDGKIPIINIPFFDVLTSKESGLLNGLPKTNSIIISDATRPFGLELNGLYNLHNQSQLPLIISAGFYYLNINEKFILSDAVYNIPSLPNSVLNLTDKFSTINSFYGIQGGTRTQFEYSNLNFALMAEIAFGVNYQKLHISGETTINNTKFVQPVGIFAELSNSGTFTKNQFAILPQLEAKIRYQINKNIRSFITYNFMYINNVIHPSNQIDRNINKSQNIAIGGSGVITNPVTPSVKFNPTSMVMQSVGIGIEIELS